MESNVTMRQVKFKSFISRVWINKEGNELPELTPYSERREYTTKPGTAAYSSDYDTDGLFHGWGYESTDSDNALVMDTYGIIEKSDGTIEHVIPNKIKFIN
jgi:hypothetical protein